jgi:threonine/homoserine/homoserine lactone efflux protein
MLAGFVVAALIILLTPGPGEDARRRVSRLPGRARPVGRSSPRRRYARPPRQSSSRIFRDGVIVSIFNPKIAMFFLAFLPQFVDPAGAPVTQQVLFLGLLYVALALITDGTYAVARRAFVHGSVG